MVRSMEVFEWKPETGCCRLCSKEIICDGVEPLPLTFFCDGEHVHYCSEHAEIGMEIFNKFYAEKSKLNKLEGYCDEYKVLSKIEGQYKDNAGDWYIKFRNKKNYGREVIDLPILKDDKPIGYIMNVDDDFITGKIWGRYIPIVEEVYAGNKRVSAFEIVC